MRDIDKEIAAKLLEVEALRKEKADIESGTTDAERLATAIHEFHCHWNHTDGCSWHYEKWSAPGHARGLYLKTAQAVLAKNYRSRDVMQLFQEIKTALR